jgi:MFS family permease
VPSSPPVQERAFRSLRFRDFRLLWAAETLSVSGSFINRAAMAWQVYDLTGSAVSLGLLGLIRFIPLILLGMVGGVLADRGDRRRTLVLSQLCLLVIALSLGLVSLAGAATPPLIYAVAVLEGGVRMAMVATATQPKVRASTT